MHLGTAVWSFLDDGTSFKGIVISSDDVEVILAAPPSIAPAGRKYSARTAAGSRSDVIFVSVPKGNVVLADPCRGDEMKFSEDMNLNVLMKTAFGTKAVKLASFNRRPCRKSTAKQARAH